MHVVILDGSQWKEFAPLSLSRPVFELASGASTLLEKHLRHLAPRRLTLWVRPEMEEYCRTRVVPRMGIPTDVNVPLDDQMALLMNGRKLMLGKFEPPGSPAVVLDENDDDTFIRTACVVKPGLSHLDMLNRTDAWMSLQDLPHMPPQGRMARHLWDLLAWNEESIIEDTMSLPHPAGPHPAGPYHMIGEEQIWLSEGARLGPGCVIDASKGPVLVGRGASIGANAVVHGPCYIGPGSAVQALALIRPGVTIGPGCKIGGEVTSSILQGNSNKAHHGYLGDSYIGEWVNLAAGTSTSNLKTTYGEVRFNFGSHEVETGRRFLGSLIGDHSKTAIDTRLMTGTYVGYCAMVAMSDLPPRFIPSFAFLTDRGVNRYDNAKAIEVMKQVFSRRDRQWTDFDARMVEIARSLAAVAEGQGG